MLTTVPKANSSLIQHEVRGPKASIASSDPETEMELLCCSLEGASRTRAETGNNFTFIKGRLPGVAMLPQHCIHSVYVTMLRKVLRQFRTFTNVQDNTKKSVLFVLTSTNVFTLYTCLMPHYHCLIPEFICFYLYWPCYVSLFPWWRVISVIELQLFRYVGKRSFHWFSQNQNQITQLVKKFPAIYGNRSFIILFTTVRHWSLSWARWIQPTTPHSPFYFPVIHSNINLLTKLCISHLSHAWYTSRPPPSAYNCDISCVGFKVQSFFFFL